MDSEHNTIIENLAEKRDEYHDKTALLSIIEGFVLFCMMLLGVLSLVYDAFWYGLVLILSMFSILISILLLRTEEGKRLERLKQFVKS